MCNYQVFFNPGNKVVLECSLNQLMEDVRSHKFMDICSGKVMRKRLSKFQCGGVKMMTKTHSDIITDTIIIPDSTRIKCFKKKLRLLLGAQVGIWIVQILGRSFTSRQECK